MGDRWKIIDGDLSQVRTGDMMLFSNNTATGFLLRTFTSSLWNHVGVAVRLKEARDNVTLSPEGIWQRISLTSEGTLYVLEINTAPRLDALSGEEVVGSGLSSYSWVARRYNTIAVRPLHENLRTYSLARRTVTFVQEYRGWVFTKGFLPFISVWLGIPLEGDKKDESRREMFCTELSVYYYLYALRPIVQHRRSHGPRTRIDLPHLFGSGCPDNPALFTPEHFTYALSPFSPIFSAPEFTIQTEPADALVVLFQPLILLLAFFVLLYMVLPRFPTSPSAPHLPPRP